MQSHADNRSVDSGFDASDYTYAAAPTTAHSPAIFAERDLWCAVIAQAFVDMGAIVPATSVRQPNAPRPDAKASDAAARWLLRNKKDFAYICDLAGVNPHIIRRAAQLFYGKSFAAIGAAHNTKE